ncbi:hypothetical protein H6P81_021055 [Aristolochia fimbriata]|uniref:SKP1 component POZ domain-containing protein n=1 Tax=Aristolochia fimbriata TaxID=158543 RepID=A0AAV7DXX8_ARIFI|nr:hypothetical protein H6P81_021055 [Aristolochia fimbriata]
MDLNVKQKSVGVDWTMEEALRGRKEGADVAIFIFILYFPCRTHAEDQIFHCWENHRAQKSDLGSWYKNNRMMWDWNGPIKVPFRCSDGEVVWVDKKYVKEFKAVLIDEIYEDGAEIPLLNISSKIMRMIVDYCDSHFTSREQREAAMLLFAAMGDAEYEKKQEELEKIEDAERDKDWMEYIEFDLRTLVQLSNAANFLNFQEFLQLMREVLLNKSSGLEVVEMNPEEKARVIAELDNLEDLPLRDDMDRCFRVKRCQ